MTVSGASWQVAVTFGGDDVGRRYWAQCGSGPNGCHAFYWGDDDDTPTHVYSIDDVDAKGQGTGSIYLYDAAGQSPAALEAITLTPDGSVLEFRLRNGTDSVDYQLIRSP